MFEQLAEAVARGPVRAHGVPLSFAAYLAARLGGPVVIVTSDEPTARRVASDAELFAGDDAVVRAPADDISPYAELSPDRVARAERMAALFWLAHRDPPPVTVVSAASLLRRVVPKDELVRLSRRLVPDDRIERDELVRALVAAGFERAPIVDDPGTYAVRGDVVDVFPPLGSYPARIELFGDDVESIRLFDPQTQRTMRTVDELWIHPVRATVPTGGADVRAAILEAADAAAHPSKATRRLLERIDAGEEFIGLDTLTPAFHARLAPLWEYLPAAATWVVIEPDAVLAAAADEHDLAGGRYERRLDDHKLAFPPEAHYVGVGELGDHLRGVARRLEVRRLDMADDPLPAIRLGCDDLGALRGALEHARRHDVDGLVQPLADALARWRDEGWRVAIACGSASRAERLAGLLAAYDLAPARSDDADLARLEPGAPPALLPGRLSAGFAHEAEKLALLSDADVFGERTRTSARQKAAAKRARSALFGGVSDFSQLDTGDLLVHRLHGVGEYRGLAKLPIENLPIDFLHLEYRGGTLYLPVYRLDEVQRYVGAEGQKPRIDRLGGTTWQKAKRKVSRQVRALAEELLQLYAQRTALPGHAFPERDTLFDEFEATFEFEETPDQQKAIDEVLADMESGRVMDRLVCGDVGYGKTEVALRAMLRAVLGGKQAALLAPTTVLVEQHHRTMAARFEGWPMEIAKLSRFQPRSEQVAVIKGLAAGTVDAVVGTHRLLSKDVRFKDLGLLVIDEEQRFGVTHKERLKKARTQIDALTLTATPIPRTLHLAMSGLRDLSIIATPPADRRSIRTFVSRVDDGVIREAVTRELSRGGQVFLVAPRIEGGVRDRSLEEWAAYLRELVPDARVAVAHGQMKTEALEKVMVGFVAGDHDVLVTTTIIENGLDIPRANTMLVARADRFGLSQLYQLRGRIGRSKERAFCYLLVPPPEKLTKDARRRLEALQRFTDLGAGFQIASHDLEIRGAGELLGARQSGAIAAVGFETYAAMLEEAVAEIKGEPISTAADPELNVDVPGFIPDDYVPDTGQRLDLYKRLAGAVDEDEVAGLLDEIRDRYGTLPVEVLALGDLMILKAYARRLRARSLDLTRTRMALALDADTPLPAGEVARLVAEPGSRYRLTPDQRLLRVFTPEEQKEVTQTARRCLLDLVGCAT